MEDRTLTLGVSGMLKDNALIMFDEETLSVWSHITGEALEGPFKGQKLKRLVSVPQITFSQVQAEYPDARVLKVDEASHVPISQYQGYHTSPAAGVRPMSGPVDDRLPAKAMVAGVEVDNSKQAYPHTALASRGAINDKVGATPIVVARVPKAEAVLVFDRRVSGRTLTFTAPDEQGRMRDEETGTTWHALRGQAEEGALAGEKLQQVPHIDMYWFGWQAYHPDTAVFQLR